MEQIGRWAETPERDDLVTVCYGSMSNYKYASLSGSSYCSTNNKSLKT